MDTQVLIVGAGPTGLTLAIDLGRRGVRCMVIEQKEAPQFLPKMERCNARTMEIYRRMGIAERVRAAGLPAHCPMDIFIVLSLIEPPLVHHVHPSVAEAKARIAKSEDGQISSLSAHFIHAEPLLKSIAETLPSVTVCELASFAQIRIGRRGVKTSDGAPSTCAPHTWSVATAAISMRRTLDIAKRKANIQQLRRLCY